MYIIAGSTGTLGKAIVKALSKENELFLIGRDEAKLKEQASAINANYQVIDLNNTVEPREFGKIIDSNIEIKGLVNCIGSILIKPLHGTSIEEFNDVITTNLFSSYYLLSSFARRMKNGSAIFFLVLLDPKVYLIMKLFQLQNLALKDLQDQLLLRMQKTICE